MSNTIILHTVSSNENLSSIARTYGVSVETIINLNKVKISKYNSSLIKRLDIELYNNVTKTLTCDYSKDHPYLYTVNSKGEVRRTSKSKDLVKGNKVVVVKRKVVRANPTLYLSYVKLEKKNKIYIINSYDVRKLSGDSSLTDYLSSIKTTTTLVSNLVLIIRSEVSSNNRSRVENNYPQLVTRIDYSIQSGPGNIIKNKINDLDSFFQRVLNGKILDECPLPVIPSEFNDSNSPSFNSVSMMGRSVEYQVYNTTGRSVSFNLQLHEEIASDAGMMKTATQSYIGDYDYIHRLVALIESCCYPAYSDSGNVNRPPEVIFKIGEQFKIRGILESCSAQWSPPYIDKKYVNCNLSISIKETTGPYSADDIVKMTGGRRGSNEVS